MEFRTCVLGRADEFLPAGSPKEGTFQVGRRASWDGKLGRAGCCNGSMTGERSHSFGVTS